MLPALAQAGDFSERPNILGADFVAPSVPSAASVTNTQVGMIIYNSAIGEFQGLNAAGSWNSMTSASGNVVTSLSGTEHIERAIIAGNSTPSLVCNNVSPTCTIVSASTPGWVSALWTSTGNYTLTFAAGEFSGIPTCTFTTGWGGVVAGGPVDQVSAPPTNTTYPIRTANLSGTSYDEIIQVICMGPR